MRNFSEESLKLRCELAYACRILAANGQNDTIYGHVTYRTEVFRARPDITCVVHTHPIYSPDVPRFTRTSDLITTRELGEEVTTTLGKGLACYLINHGIVVAGNTIEKAVVSAINLERASQAQLLTSASGQSFSWTSDEDVPGKREKIFGDDHVRSVWNYYCRRIGSV